jgi:alginate O-acetyltransferase complex protein AlgI
VLITGSTIVDFAAGRAMTGVAADRPIWRRRIVLVSILVNLGLLGTFKYLGFFARVVADLTDVFTGAGTASAFSAIDIALPVGISFYTFQSMSYSIDVYRGRVQAERSLLRFALYVSFFPQLVAGPIMRAGDFMRQLGHRRRLEAKAVFEGVHLVTRGLFLKLVVADNLGALVDLHWSTVATGEAPGALAIAVVVFFSCQLFCDFAGYCDIARGIAYPLGFRLPINFNAPFIATTFSAFWRRWHITLSQWMRDYVYLSLGGNRRGATRTLVNLFATMVISGLWHGAAATFLFWGVVHGLAMACERVLHVKARSMACRVFWFLVVQATWIRSMAVFRAADGVEAWQIGTSVLAAFADPTALLQVGDDVIAADLVTGALLTVPVWLLHIRVALAARSSALIPSRYERAILTGLMLALVASFYAEPEVFIYFQF